jgi:hypothetical protein
MSIVRFTLALVVTLAACSGGGRGDAQAVPDDDANGGDDTDGSAGTAPRCFEDSDCALGAPSCCSCPSYATSADDPGITGCDGVTCPMEPVCGDNVKAACDPAVGCVLRCVEMPCANNFAGGYAMDTATGCLACMAPAATSLGECTVDSDCVETRQDCCGCAEGGEDTAVPVTDRANYDVALHCSASPSCPGVNVCEMGAAARCVQGSCTLTAAQLPANACGRPDLVDCLPGQTCILNRDPQATELGVGVCGTP